MAGFGNVVFFLIETIFSILAFILWLRVAFRFFKISGQNPFNHQILLLTNKFFGPISKALGLSKYNTGRIDWLCLALIAILIFVKYLLTSLLFYKGVVPIFVLFISTVAEVITQPCNLMFYAIIGQVLISWFNPTWRNPIAEVLYVITLPLLERCRRMLPDTAGLDFSPLVAIFLLKVITIVIDSYTPIRVYL